MLFSYGDGEYIEGTKRIKGQIILSEHKLYLRGPEGDIATTYIPLEKIEKIRKVGNNLEVHVRQSILERYVAALTGEKKHLADLIKDIVERRGLRKKNFWTQEWAERE